MRPKAGGAALVVLDHARNCVEHGLPTEERDWTLDGVTKKPGKPSEAPKPWDCIRCGILNAAARPTCSDCGALRPWACRECGTRNPGETTRCGDCGAPRPVRKILELDDAPMAEMTADAFAHITRMSYRSLLRKPRSEAELAAYARAHGYKPGWVWFKLKEQEETFGGKRP